MPNKQILDACCASRAFGFDSENPIVLYNDIRNGEYADQDGRITFVSPKTNYDFRNLPFKDSSFYHVVFDPPHLSYKGRNNTHIKCMYGELTENWREDLQKGLSECYRVLKKHGTLIFKWSEHDISINTIMREVVTPSGLTPLYGHRTMTKQTTIWMCFYKN